ncbi:MAG: ergothioneine biosynthesis protein EgtB [Acidimicrobiales bacterium]|jgi:ergothioneine biosynthesis protein EgtB
MTDLMTSCTTGVDLGADYRLVRQFTETLASPLSAEDQTVQSMPDTSPTKWHRAHVTWFFETFVLEPGLAGYDAFNPAYRSLFNSYYEAVGERFPRPRRGVISRPGIEEVTSYRRHVDGAMEQLLGTALERPVLDIVELGLHHEQQHQELLLMDIKHALSANPLRPAYLEVESPPAGESPAAEDLAHPGGRVEIGYEGGGFSFDNELPRHEVLLRPFHLDSRPVTCGEWLAFIDDGGYRRPDLWLSDGWATVQAEGWDRPLYWSHAGDGHRLFTLGGERAIIASEPVCHMSYYEADAYARWAGGRLPTEAEWEALASCHPAEGRFLDLAVLHPQPAGSTPSLYGDVWQWTSSSYSPYPGFAPAPGAVGEYNGKFMVNQQVLRGGCCVTPAGHTRASYRNFFPPSARWPFTGVRLAHDA